MSIDHDPSPSTIEQVRERNAKPVSELTVDERFLRAAREFAFTIEGHPVRITRYDNHGGLLADGQWVARVTLGPMNHWYATMVDGKWMFEGNHGTGFSTYQQAYTAARHAMDNMIAAGLWQNPNKALSARVSGAERGRVSA
jgi:hypothetical protein